MKIYKTSNINILKTYLVGGQTSEMGNYSHGINTFDEYRETLKQNDVYSKEKIESDIYTILTDANENKLRFDYYDKRYSFKIPTGKKMERLVEMIIKKLEETDKEN